MQKRLTDRQRIRLGIAHDDAVARTNDLVAAMQHGVEGRGLAGKSGEFWKAFKRLAAVFVAIHTIPEDAPNGGQEASDGRPDGEILDAAMGPAPGPLDCPGGAADGTVSPGAGVLGGR